MSIAKVLGHDVAANNQSGCAIDSHSWRDAYLAHLEIADTYNDWLVICGSGGPLDLGQLQRLELAVLEKLLQTRSGKLVSHTGGRLLFYITVEEYRSEQVRYVQSLEIELLMLKTRTSSNETSCLSLSVEGQSMCNSLQCMSWTPSHLEVSRCQYLGSFNGIYELQPAPYSGRNFYMKRDADAYGRRASIFFLDERHGDTQCGWWLAIPNSNGRVISAYNGDTDAMGPPCSKWVVCNLSGWVLEPTLQIMPVQYQDLAHPGLA